MANNTKHFLKLLIVELDDLTEDILFLEEIQRDRLKKAEITEYVYKENDVIFQSERSAVHSLLTFLNQFDATEYKDLENLIPGLKNDFKKKIKDGQFPPGILRFVDRKMEKVMEFMKS